MYPGKHKKGSTMAWETRGSSGRYYYRSRKIDGRVIREYCGTGIKGELAHLQDSVKRAKRKLWRAKQHNLYTIDESLKDLDVLCGDLTTGFLKASGYFQHRGEWRRCNDNSADTEQ